jgi:signal transduction histidine kinase
VETAEAPLASPKILPAAAELVERIEWLIRLRWIAVLGVVCTIEAARRILGLPLALGPLYGLTAGLAFYNLILTVFVKRLERVQRTEPARRPRALPRSVVRMLWGMNLDVEAPEAAALANIQISIDLLLLALLLHFAGGIENPFIIFFIFHIIIASILLSPRATCIQATLGFGLISAVAFSECFGILRHYPLGGMWTADGYRHPTVVGVELFVLGATLYLSVYMGTTIAGHLRRREREVATLSGELAEKAELVSAAYRKVRQTERLKSQYMRKVAHELRGPLGTIKTALQVVLEGIVGEIPERSRDLISRAERRVGELADLTRDLLILSRAREGKLKTEMVPVNPGELIAGVLAEMRSTARRAGITLTSTVAKDLGDLRADPAGLQQLASNLVSNSIRYTPRGGNVEVRLYRKADSLWLEVEDTGIGIPEEDISRLFEDFFRSANARERVPEGTGLGLSIVRAVAEEHGGKVTVESTPGKGTRFTVELPVEPVATITPP